MLCRITYALDRDGQAVHISEAERGRACDCICPGCGQPLTAKLGQEMGHHFAHAGAEDCPFGYINSLYHALRRALLELGYIALPPYVKNRSILNYGGGQHEIIRKTKVRVDSVDFTRKGGESITGLLVTCSGRQLIIRLMTAYSDNSRSLDRIKALGMPVVELDLSREDEINNELARGYFSSRPDNLNWLYNAFAEEIWEAMLARCARQSVSGEENAIYTYGCSIAANHLDGGRCYIKDRCVRCPFFFGLYGFEENRYVLCGSGNLVAEPEDLTLPVADRRRKYTARRS